MTIRSRILVATLLGALVSDPAAAQSASPDRPAPRRPGWTGAGEPGRRPDEMRRSLGLFFVHRARIALDLGDQQALKLLPLVEKAEKLRQESAERRSAIARQLEDLAQKPEATDAEVLPLVRLLDQEEERMRTDQARVRDEMLALFTPAQKARFVIFANRFRGAVEEQVRAMRPNRRPGDPPPDQGDLDLRDPPGVP